MAVTLVQTGSGTQASGASLTVTLGSGTGGGNCLVVALVFLGTGANPTGATITLGGAAGNFSNRIIEASGSSTVAGTGIWVCEGIASGQTAVAITVTGGTGPYGMFAYVYEFSGVAGVSAIDKIVGTVKGAASTAFTSNASATTTGAPEAWVGVAGVAAGAAVTLTGPSSPWANLTALSGTIAGVASGSVSGSQIATATGTCTYSGTISASELDSACAVTLLPAPVPATGRSAFQYRPPRRARIGAGTSAGGIAVQGATALLLPPARYPSVPGLAVPGLFTPGDPGPPVPAAVNGRCRAGASRPVVRARVGNSMQAGAGLAAPPAPAAVLPAPQRPPRPAVRPAPARARTGSLGLCAAGIASAIVTQRGSPSRPKPFIWRSPAPGRAVLGNGRVAGGIASSTVTPLGTASPPRPYIFRSPPRRRGFAGNNLQAGDGIASAVSTPLGSPPSPQPRPVIQHLPGRRAVVGGLTSATAAPVTLRAASTASTGSAAGGAAPLNFTIPAGTVIGDILVIWAFAGTSSAVTWSAAGWTAVTAVSGTNGACQILYRTATGTEGSSVTVTCSVAEQWAGVIAGYYNVSSASPFDPAPASGQVNASSTTVAAASITTAIGGDKLLWFGAIDAGSGGTPAVLTVPAGFTPEVTQVSTSSASGTNAGVIYGDFTQVTAGATGAGNGAAASAHANAGCLISIAAAPGTVYQRPPGCASGIAAPPPPPAAPSLGSPSFPAPRPVIQHLPPHRALTGNNLLCGDGIASQVTTPLGSPSRPKPFIFRSPSPRRALIPGGNTGTPGGGLGSQVTTPLGSRPSPQPRPVIQHLPPVRARLAHGTPGFPGPLNANTGFETGTAPWNAVNGTVTQSSAQAYQGTFSALLTPAGGTSLAWIESEQVPVVPGVSYVTSCEAYSPAGWAGGAVCNINWYDARHVYLTTTGPSATALPAAAWTFLTSGPSTVPAGAFYATCVPTEAGTPTTGAVVYFDAAQLASVPPYPYTISGTGTAGGGLASYAATPLGSPGPRLPLEARSLPPRRVTWRGGYGPANAVPLAATVVPVKPAATRSAAPRRASWHGLAGPANAPLGAPGPKLPPEARSPAPRRVLWRGHASQVSTPLGAAGPPKPYVTRKPGARALWRGYASTVVTPRGPLGPPKPFVARKLPARASVGRGGAAGGVASQAVTPPGSPSSPAPRPVIQHLPGRRGIGHGLASATVTPLGAIAPPRKVPLFPPRNTRARIGRGTVAGGVQAGANLPAGVAAYQRIAPVIKRPAPSRAVTGRGGPAGGTRGPVNPPLSSALGAQHAWIFRSPLPARARLGNALQNADGVASGISTPPGTPSRPKPFVFRSPAPRRAVLGNNLSCGDGSASPVSTPLGIPSRPKPFVWRSPAPSRARLGNTLGCGDGLASTVVTPPGVIAPPRLLLAWASHPRTRAVTGHSTVASGLAGLVNAPLGSPSCPAPRPVIQHPPQRRALVGNNGLCGDGLSGNVTPKGTVGPPRPFVARKPSQRAVLGPQGRIGAGIASTASTPLGTPPVSVVRPVIVHVPSARARTGPQGRNGGGNPATAVAVLGAASARIPRQPVPAVPVRARTGPMGRTGAGILVPAATTPAAARRPAGPRSPAPARARLGSLGRPGGGVPVTSTGTRLSQRRPYVFRAAPRRAQAGSGLSCGSGLVSRAITPLGFIPPRRIRQPWVSHPRTRATAGHGTVAGGITAGPLFPPPPPALAGPVTITAAPYAAVTITTDGGSPGILRPPPPAWF